MAKKVIIWGASGHAKVLRELVEQIGYRVLCTFDNNRQVPPPFPDVPIRYGHAGFLDWRAEYGQEEVSFLVAIGGARGVDRAQIQAFLEGHGLRSLTVVHPSAYVARNASLGKGCQVLANATISAEAKAGETCIINTAASLDHECSLGTGVHIAPGATLAGCVTVGDFSLISVGAVILPRITIGRHVIVGAGAVVTRDIPDHKLAYGIPARVIRDNLPSAPSHE